MLEKASVTVQTPNAQLLTYTTHALDVPMCPRMVVRMTGLSGICGKKIDLASNTFETQDEAKCFGIWLRCDL